MAMILIELFKKSTTTGFFANDIAYHYHKLKQDMIIISMYLVLTMLVIQKDFHRQ